MDNNFLFNLIRLYSRPANPEFKMVDPVKHCEQNGHHDFYCDAERPYIHKYNY